MKTFIAGRREFLKQSGVIVVGFSLAFRRGLRNSLRCGPCCRAA